MGKILFASNNPTHFGPNAFTTTSYITDTSRIPFAIAFNANISTPQDGILPTTTGEVWIHFRAQSQNNNPSGDPTQDCMKFFDDQGRTLILARTSLNSQTVDWTFYDTAGGSIVFNDRGAVSDGVGAWDIRMIFDPFNITYEVYKATVLLCSHTFTSNPNAVDQLGRVDWLETWHYAGNGHISEVIIADSDTRLARLNMIRPNGVGFHSDWVGLVNTLADNNVNTGMTTNSVNQRQSVTLEAYTNTEIISNVLLVSQHFKGANAPGTIRHFIRASGIDYDNANAFTVAFNNTVNFSDYEINPATALPWELADLNNFEFGFKSEA